jgi:Mn-containing catalase
MLNKGGKGRLSEAAEQEGELYRSITGAGNDSHLTQVLYGGGPALTHSAGTPWTAAYIDTIGEPTADLRSNIAAEARAKVVYERLINLTDDGGVKDALKFLMTREIAHQKSFEKALYAIEPNFPSGKLPGDPRFTHTYFNLSQGEGDTRGPWNQGEQWKFVDGLPDQLAVDGGDGSSSAKLTKPEAALVAKMASRTRSNPSSDPVTGAELGSDGVGGPVARLQKEGPLTAVVAGAPRLASGSLARPAGSSDGSRFASIAPEETHHGYLRSAIVRSSSVRVLTGSSRHRLQGWRRELEDHSR